MGLSPNSGWCRGWCWVRLVFEKLRCTVHLLKIAGPLVPESPGFGRGGRIGVGVGVWQNWDLEELGLWFGIGISVAKSWGGC